MNQPWRVIVVGGASGVGKTTLLRRANGVHIVNTGTLFKNRMTLADRDDVRNVIWSDYEEAVISDLADIIESALAQHGLVVIDTHFAAKLRKSYRIGLKASLLFTLARRTFAYASQREQPLLMRVLLVNCDPLALLQRRRRDTTRSRELVPVDCYNAVRENEICSRKYLFEFRRALDQHGECGRVDYFPIENDDLQIAGDRMLALLEG